MSDYRSNEGDCIDNGWERFRIEAGITEIKKIRHELRSNFEYKMAGQRLMATACCTALLTLAVVAQSWTLVVIVTMMLPVLCVCYNKWAEWRDERWPGPGVPEMIANRGIRGPGDGDLEQLRLRLTRL
jgi:hypothetical protein